MPVFAVKKVVLRGKNGLVFADFKYYFSMLAWSDPNPRTATKEKLTESTPA
jgi:hypothetical protein